MQTRHAVRHEPAVADPLPVDDAPASGRKGLGPCWFYLLVEFARPMAWVPAFGALRPGLIAALWGLGVVLVRRPRPIPQPVRYMIGFLLLMAWQVPWARNNRWALWGLEDFAILVLGGVLPLAVLPGSLAAVRALLSAYVFFHIPTSIYALSHGGRGVGGWMGDENDLALALNAAIGVGLYLLLETRSKIKKLMLIGALVPMGAAVIASRSRGGFVGIAVLIAYVLIVGPKRRTIALCGAVAIVAALLFTPASYWDEMRSITAAAKPGDTGETRLYYWGIAWQMFTDHPLTGVGTDNYGIRAPEYQDARRKGWAVHTWGRVAHSMYFTLLAEQGLVGVVLFAALLIWCVKVQKRLRSAWKQNAEDEAARTAALLASGIMVGIIGVLATGTFLSCLYYPILWVLAGLMGALAAVRQPAPGIAQPSS